MHDQGNRSRTPRICHATGSPQAIRPLKSPELSRTLEIKTLAIQGWLAATPTCRSHDRIATKFRHRCRVRVPLSNQCTVFVIPRVAGDSGCVLKCIHEKNHCSHDTPCPRLQGGGSPRPGTPEKRRSLPHPADPWDPGTLRRGHLRFHKAGYNIPRRPPAVSLPPLKP